MKLDLCGCLVTQRPRSPGKDPSVSRVALHAVDAAQGKIILFERNGFVHIRDDVYVTCITLKSVCGHPPSLTDESEKYSVTTSWLTEPSHPTGIDQAFCVVGRRVEPYRAGGRNLTPLSQTNTVGDEPLSDCRKAMEGTLFLNNPQ